MPINAVIYIYTLSINTFKNNIDDDKSVTHTTVIDKKNRVDTIKSATLLSVCWAGTVMNVLEKYFKYLRELFHTDSRKF
jgi:hypothetical protein